MALNQGCVYREVIGARGDGRALVEYLTHRYRHSSSCEWRDRIRAGLVTVDGIAAGPERRLRTGEVLAWHRPPWDEPDVPTRVDVLYEDEALVAVNKPRGVPTLPGGGFLEHTLLALVGRRYPDARPAHRLGRHTTGVVLFSRNHASAARLAAAWRGHEVFKEYRTLAAGLPTWDQLEIDTPIGPVPHALLGSVHGAVASGRASRSVVRVMERRDDSALCRVEIITGRPHQVRIHLAWAGHPLVGDPLYGPGGVPIANAGLPGDGGYLLHSEHLGFVHPVSGTWMDLHAPVPEELKRTGLSFGR